MIKALVLILSLLVPTLAFSAEECTTSVQVQQMIGDKGKLYQDFSSQEEIKAIKVALAKKANDPNITADTYKFDQIEVYLNNSDAEKVMVVQYTNGCVKGYFAIEAKLWNAFIVEVFGQEVFN